VASGPFYILLMTALPVSSDQQDMVATSSYFGVI
jgi:hypothetical protein